MGALLVIAMYLVVGLALSQTPWGRHVYAVGDDASAARLVGIQVWRLLLSVYVLTGVIVALSAWVLIGRVGAATTSSAVDANLDSITAVVIGGTSLFGGRGSVPRNPSRRRDRRRLSQWAGAGASRRPLSDLGHRTFDHRRRLPRPMDPRGENAAMSAAIASASRDDRDAQVPVLSARGLVKTFGPVVALDGVDIDLYRGEVLAVIGDNGAGKSVLIKCLTGAEMPGRRGDQSRWETCCVPKASGCARRRN